MNQMLLVVAGLVLSICVARAESLKPGESPPIFLWSFQRGCTPDPVLADKVHSIVKRMAYPVHKLNPPATWANCEGAACVHLLEQTCTTLPKVGALMGGRGELRAGYTVYTMWLYELATGKTAYLDHYCRGCDLATKLADSADSLIERPIFGPHEQPPYCPAGRKPRPAALPPVTKVHFVAYGDGKHKSAIAATIESFVKRTGMRAEPIAFHSRDYNTPEIARRIAPNGLPEQIILADVQTDGKVDLHLYDARVQASDYLPIECPGCDKDQIVAKIEHGVSVLIDRCRGETCGLPAERVPAPPEVCQSFPQCEALPLLPMTSERLPAPVSSAQTRRNRVLTGLAWGAFGVSAATSAVLFGLQTSSLGTIEGSRATAQNIFLGPAITAAGLSLLSLGVAVPMTVYSQRDKLSVIAPASALQCPQWPRSAETIK